MERLRVRVVYPLLALGVLIVFAPAFGYNFVNFDDPQYVLENPHVRDGLTWSGVRWALTATHAGNWHPVTWLSHMIDVELYGLDARGHHATSILLHLANTLLLFALLHRMTGDALPSAVVAALFGVHPLRVESVVWVAERKDVLSAFLALLAIGAYVRYVRRPSAARYTMVLGLFVLGLAAKPMLVTLPFVLLLLDAWPLDRLRAGRAEGSSRMRTAVALLGEKAPLLLCAALGGALTFMAQQGAGAVRSLEALPVAPRLANAAVAYVAYLGRILVPVNLAPLYPYPAAASLGPPLAAAGLLALVTVFAFRAWPRRGYATVGWLWFVGMLVPVIGIVQVGSQSMADRYTYLPAVGVFLVLAWGGRDLLGRAPAGRLALAGTAVGAVVVSAWLARQQVAVWESSIRLWEHTVRVTRDNARAHANLAHALAWAGRVEDAIGEYRAALNLNPDSVEIRTGLGAALASAGRLEEAIPHYEHALRLDAADATAHANLGAALASRGRLAEAESHLRESLRVHPDVARTHGFLAIVLAGTGRGAEAIEHFTKAVELAPDDPAAHRHLGSALAANGRPEQAIASLQSAVRLDPGDARARNALGAILAGSGRLDEAVTQYEAAIRLDPTMAEAHANLGNALGRLDRPDRALTYLQEAVRLRPGDAVARYDMAVLLARQGRRSESTEQLESVLRIDPDHAAARRLLGQLNAAGGSVRRPGSSR